MVDQKVKVTFQVKAVCLTIISPQVQLKDGNNSSLRLSSCWGFYERPPRAHQTACSALMPLEENG